MSHAQIGKVALVVVVLITSAIGSPAARALVSTSSSTGGNVLLGKTSIGPTSSALRAGTAEAVQFTAAASGSGVNEGFYVDGYQNVARTVIVGVYSDASNRPGTLLASGSAAPTPSAWDQVTIPGVSITAGRKYWLAFLGTGGQLGFRFTYGGCSTTRQTGLTSLPARFAGSSSSPGCASIQLDATAAAPTAPSNTSRPSVSGTTQPGDALVASTGSWSGTTPMSYGYQWQHCASSSSCTNISGATGSSYTLQSSDVGDSVDVAVTATNAGGSANATSAQTATVADPPPPPSNTASPVISGSTVQGQTLTTTTGSWSGSPSSYTYQWQDCTASGCSDIPGATATSYTLQASDVGDTVDVVVTATNAAGSGSAASGKTATVTAVAPSNTALPVISGQAVQGQTLTTSDGSWSGSPSSYSYQWQDCTSAGCSNISGATAPSYTLQSSDLGDTLDVVVTAANSGGSASATSAQTATVTAAPANTALPVISGTSQQGQALTTTNGSWTNSPSSYSYQWQDCTTTACSNIAGATSSSYTLQASDVGSTIDVIVTATNSAGSTSATSAHTATVAPPPPSNTAPPVISGTVQQGQTLTTTNGSWSNSPSSYSYQWQDCTTTACSNIAGATSSSYTLQGSDVGDALDVVVTATNPGGSGSATSAQTATVTTVTPPSNTALPVISGTAQQGQTLTTTNGSWSNSPSSYSYQWQDCTTAGCSNIAGATTSSYTLQASDVGDTLDVMVKASNAGGSGSATSAPTGTVQTNAGGGSGPANTALPVVTGNTLTGGTLSTTTGSWSGTPTSYTYQWQDCIGSSCSNIAGATSSTYTVQSSDVGYSLAAVVTAHNSSGAGSASSFNTAAAAASTVGKSLVSATYLLGFAPPSGCSSLNATCLTTTDPPNWNAVNEAIVFTLTTTGDPAAKDAITTGTVSGTISSIPASVTATIPAGPIMLTTSPSSPSSGSYQILQTSGAASGATSIPITGSPVANSSYPSGSAIMVQALNSSQNSVPTGSTLSGVVNAIHAGGAKAFASIGGSTDSETWGTNCVNGFQYLLGATLAQYVAANGFDGIELDTESGSQSNWSTCWNGAAEEIHSVTTAAGHVPIVYVDFNETNTSASIPAAAQTQVDQFAFFWYGWQSGNVLYNNYTCANSCSQLAGYLNTAINAGTPAPKWLSGQGVSAQPSSNAFAQQLPATVLSTTTSSVSGAVTSIPVSPLSAAIPQGTIILADSNTAPTRSEILETSGAASGATSIPITGYCGPAGWKYGTGNCATTSPVTLNATYASGDDIVQSLIGYPTGTYDAGGWDCGPNAAFAAAHNMLGVMIWADDGSSNTKLCFNQIQPFASGGFG